MASGWAKTADDLLRCDARRYALLREGEMLRSEGQQRQTEYEDLRREARVRKQRFIESGRSADFVPTVLEPARAVAVSCVATALQRTAPTERYSRGFARSDF